MATIIQTDRLRLRELTLDDLFAVYALSREDSMARWIPDQVYAYESEAREVIDLLMTCYEKRLYPYVLGVELIETDTLIGHVGLSETPEGIEIGYAIGEDYQRRGYATEAVTAVINWAREGLNLKLIYGFVKDGNIASLSVLAKTEFVRCAEQTRTGWVMMVRS